MPELSQLRICFLAGTLAQGGAERQLYYIVESLRSAGAEVSILSLTVGEFWEARLAALGATVHHVGSSPSRLCRAREISRTVRRIRPDVVHSQHFFTNIYAVIAARWTRVREVGSIRNDAVHEVGEHSRLLGLASLRLPRTLAVNSRQGERNAVGLGVSVARLSYLPNVIDPDRFQVARAAQSGELRICCVARLVPQKRIDVLLRALDALRRRTAARFTATIVGSGPERASLESLARELELTPDHVVFAGSVADPAAYYEQADVAVLASDWEGTPNVLLEAMASGLPVVATAVGGIPEIVTHGITGLLAPAGNPDEFADRLSTLCETSELRRELGDNARRYVVQHHSPAVLPGYLQRLYSAALA